MITLTEAEENDKLLPTRDNILKGINWLVEGAQAGDQLFFYYSGHGSCVPDKSGDEDDGFDETIVPVDYKFGTGEEGQIIDDDLHILLVKSLKKGVQLTALFDSAQSATILDLPFIYRPNSKVSESGISLFQIGKKILDQAINVVSSGPATQGIPISSEADVFCISGSEDSDRSMTKLKLDGKQKTGAVSSSYIAVVKQSPTNLSVSDLINRMNQWCVSNKVKERPILSTAHPIDLNSKYLIC